METLFSFKYMRVLIAALLVMIILALLGVVAQAFQWSWTEPNYATINVEGYAEVNAIPDVGVFSFSVEAENMDVATAQEESGNKINDIMTFLKSEGGVEAKDIKTTGYNTYPRYEWEASRLCVGPDCGERERVLRGYVVTQSVTVKVRETDKAGELIAGVGSRGATNMSGLSFEVDDLEGKKEEARLLATADAKEKAKRLADELGVRLGDVVNFSDGGNGGYYPMPMMAESRAVEMDMAYGVGGDGVEEKAFAPEISVGEDEITARVTITYKIK